jgi:hypothetical protein
MCKKLLFSILGFIFIMNCKAQITTVKDPQTSIETSIEACISLLENKEYKTMLEKYVSLDDMEKILKEHTIDEFVLSFAEKKADRMLNALKLAKGKKIEYEENGTVGIIKFEKVESGPNEFIFIKIGELWYITD